MKFAEENGTVRITIAGQGSCEDVPSLAAQAKDSMRNGCRAFVVDLADCSGLDPEFIGTLAGIALHLDELGSGSVRLLHLTPALEAGIRELGLERLFELQSESPI